MATVLVVDDAAVDRRLAGGILARNPDLTLAYAANGAEALAQIERESPQLVLTDLRMPEIDGLELVQIVRNRYPLVPVVLMTSYGSEEIAVRALQRGAASYIPKSRLADDLLSTVEMVLGVARANRRHQELLGKMTHNRWTFVLDNDPSLIPPLVDFFQHHIAALGLCDGTGRIRVGIALEEALLNALYHGNLDVSAEWLREASAGLLRDAGSNPAALRRQQAPYRERRIHVQAQFSPVEAEFTIRDEGRGFNPATIPDLTDPVNLEAQSGRGVMLMRTFMDRVSYNEPGNEVTMWKRVESGAR